MQESLNGNGLANTIKMKRYHSHKAFFIVEGITDVRSLERCTNRQHCEIISGYGKSAVFEAMCVLNEDDADDTVALVDRDFGHWVDEQIPSNIYRTTMYDRETDLLLISGLLTDYMDGIRDESKSQAALATSGDNTLEDMIIRIASSIGTLRWTSLRSSFGLALSKVPIPQILDDKLYFSVHTLIAFSILKTTDCSFDESEIEMAYRVPLPTVNLREMCRGHDIVAAVSATSRHWCKDPIGIPEIRRFITAAVRLDLLAELSWYYELKEWAFARGHTIWEY